MGTGTVIVSIGMGDGEKQRSQMRHGQQLFPSTSKHKSKRESLCAQARDRECEHGKKWQSSHTSRPAFSGQSIHWRAATT